MNAEQPDYNKEVKPNICEELKARRLKEKVAEKKAQLEKQEIIYK